MKLSKDAKWEIEGTKYSTWGDKDFTSTAIGDINGIHAWKRYHFNLSSHPMGYTEGEYVVRSVYRNGEPLSDKEINAYYNAYNNR